jgi:hypothetical protein
MSTTEYAPQTKGALKLKGVSQIPKASRKNKKPKAKYEPEPEPEPEPSLDSASKPDGIETTEGGNKSRGEDDGDRDGVGRVKEEEGKKGGEELMTRGKTAAEMRHEERRRKKVSLSFFSSSSPTLFFFSFGVFLGFTPSSFIRSLGPQPLPSAFF